MIKRYPNRKLYDTQEKKYIQLKGIMNLIRSGVEIQVLDHVTGEDLTTVILTQVITGVEKQKSGTLPSSVLAGLIRLGEDRLSALQRNLLDQLGFWRQVDEQIEIRMNHLIEAGEIDASIAQNILPKLLTKHAISPSDTQTDGSMQIERLLARRELPSRQRLNQVLTELDALLDRLNELTTK